MITTYPYKSTNGLLVYAIGYLIALPFYIIFELFFLLYRMTTYVLFQDKKTMNAGPVKVINKNDYQTKIFRWKYAK